MFKNNVAKGLIEPSIKRTRKSILVSVLYLSLQFAYPIEDKNLCYKIGFLFNIYFFLLQNYMYLNTFEVLLYVN